ncbi:coagulation factor XIII B chain-like [Anomaloglossus baeobatrachus]
MGARFSPSLANIVMARWEEDFLYAEQNRFSGYLLWYGRYLDDLLMIWSGPTDTIRDFLTFINDNDFNLKFTSSYHETTMNFLDITLCSENTNRVIIKPYRKSTATNSIVTADSCHHSRTKHNIPVGELIRMKRNCSQPSDYFKEEILTCDRLADRGYPDWVLNRAKSIVAQIDRSELLGKNSRKGKYSNKLKQSNNIVFSTNYSKQYDLITKIVNKYLPIFAITCKHGSSVYKDKDVISYTCPDGKRPKYNLVQCFNYGWGPPIICEDLKPDQPDAIIPPPDNEEKEEKRQKCPLVHNPRYAEIIDLKETYYSKDEVTMKCTRGYRMYGSATIRCMEGKWEQPPECYEIGNRCGPPPTIQFGDSIEIRKFSYEPGEFVEYQCPSYHVVKGEKIVRCLNSVWGEVPICLEPCTAKENSMDENNIQPKVLGEKKIYLTHGDEIEFDCIFGYEALPNTQMKITCEHGKLEYPICLRKGFCILQQSTMLANNVHYNISTVVERGQTITFQCTKDMVPEKGLEATCKLGILQYPKCTAAKSSV